MQHEKWNIKTGLFMTKRFILTLWAFLSLTIILAQSGSIENAPGQQDTKDSVLSGRNELTIYVIPSKVKYDWSSPNSLFKSYFKNFRRNFFKKEKYILGHAFIELKTPLLSERIFTGMTAASKKELTNLVLKEHYGLSILGADTRGKLESSSDLDEKIIKYSKQGRLAFMTLFISDEAAERMINFFQSFKAEFFSNGSEGARYGGAFWPRYEGEGSGCSAFVLSFLDVAGLLKEDFDEWLVKINIPMDLIGGPYNDNHEVKLGDIKKQHSWADHDGTDSTGYEPFEIYDPTLIYEWIQEKWEEPYSENDLFLTPLELNKAKGIRIDSRNQPLPEDEGVFHQRSKHSIFIDYYQQKSGAGN